MSQVHLVIPDSHAHPAYNNKRADANGEKIVWYTKNGDEWERVGTPVLIGNGSVCEVTVAVYDAGAMGKGQRLESIRIIDLIEYKPEGSAFDNTIVRGEAPKEIKTPWGN